MSHYDFRKSIALGWLDWHTHWPTRYKDQSTNKTNRSPMNPRPTASIITRSTRSTSSQVSDISGVSRDNSKKRCKSSLGFEDEKSSLYSSRLVFSSENNHIAEPVRSKSSECQLHKWVLGGGTAMCRRHTRVKSQLMVCPTCNIVLCIKCYKKFHTVYDLKTIKLSI